MDLIASHRMALKPKKLKITLRPGSRLSAHFNNCRDHYKIVEKENVLGYVVLHSAPRGVAAVYPLYTAFIHTKVGTTWHMMASYEQGPRLNAYTYQEDHQGCTLASIASQAIAALEARLPAQPPVKQAPSKKRKRRG